MPRPPTDARARSSWLMPTSTSRPSPATEIIEANTHIASDSIRSANFFGGLTIFFSKLGRANDQQALTNLQERFGMQVIQRQELVKRNAISMGDRNQGIAGAYGVNEIPIILGLRFYQRDPERQHDESHQKPRQSYSPPLEQTCGKRLKL